MSIPELIDTHCHLLSGELARRTDDVIASAIEAGVTRMVNISCAVAEWDAALALQRRYAGRLWTATGIHPHDAAGATEADFERLAQTWRLPGVVGAGEMGLDYHYDFSPRPVQQAVFARQLEIASSLDLPIVVHCREAHADVVRLLLKQGYAGRKVVFHCFSGTRAEAAELWGHGWWTSFTGTITYKKNIEQQQVCAEAAPDQIFFETDAPYLSPEPVRKMRPNEPGNIIHTVRFAAALRGETFEQLAERSTRNAMRFFNLDPSE
ncbi:MAG TPA: TatD family hydrolase [Phycisphaerae bacterium]|nr:TatD family hydrolase [Phycisphaerae bacterium]HOJ75894.1 TatD family hydrolase [Phycisphaerae bacterium]HOM52330.1 TatD family hydrolase [Phycisphaerae bacterium]HON69316.1 TatD family hydrolase [Phycisphaerae bacterium]HOQ87970.1 TatD family hydrolase [Phycisphaerae bacterium]